MFLMLGRDENTPSESSKKSNSSSSSLSGYEEEVVESERQTNEEVDDDSPYFVKITLDSWFLSHLEEPALVESSEVPSNTDVLLQNKVFKEIIQREFEMMFGIEKKSVRDEEEVPVLNTNESKLHIPGHSVASSNKKPSKAGDDDS